MLKLIWVNTNSVQCLYILKYLKIIVLPLPTFDLVCVSNLLRSNQLIPRNPPPCLPTCCLPPGFFSGRLLPLSLFMYFHWELLLHLHTCLCVLFCHLAFEKTLLRPLTIFLHWYHRSKREISFIYFSSNMSFQTEIFQAKFSIFIIIRPFRNI